MFTLERGSALQALQKRRNLKRSEFSNRSCYIKRQRKRQPNEPGSPCTGPRPVTGRLMDARRLAGELRADLPGSRRGSTTNRKQCAANFCAKLWHPYSYESFEPVENFAAFESRKLFRIHQQRETFRGEPLNFGK